MAASLPHPVLISTFLGLDEITLMGRTMEFKHVVYTWIGMGVLLSFAAIARRNLTLVPGKLQNFCETVIDGLEQVTVNNVGEEGRAFSL